MASLEALEALQAATAELKPSSRTRSRARAMLYGRPAESAFKELPASAPTAVLPMAKVPEVRGNGGATAAAGSSAAAATVGVPKAAGGLMVSGAKAMRDRLEGKKLLHGSAKIRSLMPRGAFGLQLKVPKRKEFGEEGAEGDAAHEAAMERFSIKEFGSTHVKESTILVRMQRVGAFGWWLQLNHYGKYVEWFVTEGARGKERNIVAVERRKEREGGRDARRTKGSKTVV